MKYLLFSFLLIINFAIAHAQQITCSDSSIAKAYRLALNIVDENTRNGILAAGADYGGEWTRDISINSWNGVSLLKPGVAEQSLWSVTIKKDSIGHQYWDQIIWTVAALNHFKVTGDSGFLKQAFVCSRNTIKKLEEEAFDSHYGLFTGPSVFNDGIAGYPEPIYDSTNKSSYVLDYPNAKNIKCLSTNCVYYGAYQSLAEMARVLNAEPAVVLLYASKADKLKQAILKNFYARQEHTLYYLIDHTGKVNTSQEGLGISFAILFGVLDKQQALAVTKHVAISAFGVTSIYPDFTRYSKEKPGRHNNIVWPMVSGFYAQASIAAGNYSSFDNELNSLTHLALDSDKGNGDFREIYNAYTGVPDGGWQQNGSGTNLSHWASYRKQTWSATAYLNMVQYGMAGMRFNEDGISFSPYLPKNVQLLQLTNIPYRNAIINLTVKGSGSRIKSFLVNGKKMEQNILPATMKGSCEIVIELAKE